MATNKHISRDHLGSGRRRTWQLVLVCCAVSDRVTLRNLVREVIDVETVVNAEADREESRRRLWDNVEG